MLDTSEFYTCLAEWIASLQLDLSGQTVAIDGKTLRRSFDKQLGKGALHVVTAWASGLRLSLGQLATDEKIRSRGADYVLQVKANQPNLHEELQQLFIDYGDADYRGVRRCKTVDENHGREELREYFVAPAPKGITRQWPGAASVGMVYRHRQAGDSESHEVSFFLSSLPPKMRAIAKHIREHWGVENSLHWSLEVTFSEDDSRIRKGNGQEIAAGFRRLAHLILKRDTTLKETLRGKRLRAGWNNDTLQAILTGIAA